MNKFRVLLATAVAASLFAAAAFSVAQAQTNAATIPLPVKITTGGTFQLILPAIGAPPAMRRLLIIENNNVSAASFSADLCYIIVGGAGQVVAGTTTLSTNITINGVTLTAAQASSVYSAGGSYNRTWPLVPSDAVYGTCATTGDSLYVETQ